MLRKLILLAIAWMMAKKLIEQARPAQMPFPTASRPPEGYGS
jgi:hypothetical protein